MAVLSVVLLLACAWSAKLAWWRHTRRSWKQPLAVDVVLLRREGVPLAAVTTLRDALPRLERALQGEYLRYRPGAPAPFRFTVKGPVQVDGPPPDVPEQEGLAPRLSHYYRLWRYLGRVKEQGHLRLGSRSLRVYVVIEPVRTRVRFVEGFGAVGGDFGVVRAAIDDHLLDQALLAIGHEMLHCLGASDKYDAHGHAVAPEGLADPAAGYPQRHAEIMVGEVAVAPGRGRLAESLSEVRVGPVTAREIGWLR